MEFVFTPEHIVVNDLFGNDMEYIIPEYQRPYSWDCLGKSDRNNQVNVMWEDLLSFYEGDQKGEYFFGSMVLIEKASRSFEVIDGQQRLTTLIILFVSIKCFCNDIVEKKQVAEGSDVEIFLKTLIEDIDTLIYNKRKFGALTVEKKVKIQKSSGFDYDAILASVMECGAIPSRHMRGEESEHDNVSLRYFKNREFFVEKLKTKFFNGKQFERIDAEQLNKFFEFLKNRLSLVRIKAADFGVAYHVFEILNNRGLPLSNKDLFRNFIIKEFDKIRKEEPAKYGDIDPAAKWHNLEESYEFRDDFLGRWVESITARQQKYSAFNDIIELYEKTYKDIPLGKRKIEQLYDDIERDLAYYSLIVLPEDIEDRKIRNKVKFLMYCGNARYTTNLLLALFRFSKFDGKNNQQVLELIMAYERHMIDILIVGGRFSNVPIYQAISYLLSTGWVDVFGADFNFFSAAISSLDSANPIFKDETSELSYIQDELDQYGIQDNYTGKLLIAKYIWSIEQNTDEDTVDQVLNFDTATLEHIIPQHPDKNTNWIRDFTKDFRDDFTYTLGNMTLLTHRMNSAIKNYDFSIKKGKYKETKLAITTEIALLDTISEDYIAKRNDRIIKAILEDIGIKYKELG